MAKKDLPRQLNVCIVAKQFPIMGRAARNGFLWPLAKGLARQGHKVTVLTWQSPLNEAQIFQDDVHVFFLGEKSYQPISEMPQLVHEKFAELHNKEPFHLVHCMDPTGKLIGKHKKHYNILTTYDVNSTQMAQIFSILGMSQDTLKSLLETSIAVFYKFVTTFYGSDRSLLNTADGVFVTSPFQKIVLERYYLYPEYRTYLVPYGIEVSDFEPKEKPSDLRKHLGIPSNAKTVVTATDMTELEEVKNLLKSFEKVAVKKPSSRLIIIGHGPLRKDIEFEMLNLALGRKVIFTGAIKNSQIPDYIALADVFVNLSSRTTGFEANLIEAMAQEKIIIGSEVSPISTIVEHSQEGFLIRPADINALSRLLIKIFDNRVQTQQIGQAARQKVLKMFDLDNMVRKTISAYFQTLIKSGHYKKPNKTWTPSQSLNA